MRIFLASLIIAGLFPALAKGEMIKLPESPSQACGNQRARLYDECGDQMEILSDAVALAQKSNKSVLVSFGAEWCIWCHVFDKYLEGEHGKFRYDYDGNKHTLNEKAKSDVSAQAAALRKYAEDNFILVHIEADNSPNGWDVLVETGASDHFQDWFPMVFVIDDQGQYLAQMNHDIVEQRRDGLWDWYRGYDRRALLSVLKDFRELTKRDDKL